MSENDQNMAYGEVSLDPDSATEIQPGLAIDSSVARQQSKAIDYFEADEYTEDAGNPQVFGRTFVFSIYKILKFGTIYEVEHNQTRIAIQEFLEFFHRAMGTLEEPELSILIRDELGIVNGEPLRLKRKAQARLNELRELFAGATIKGLLLHRDMSADDLTYFLKELKSAVRKSGNMEHVQIPTISIEHGKPSRNLLEEIMNVDKSLYVLHVYVRGLVKMKNLHDLVRDQQSADVPTGIVRRIMQSVAELLADEDYTILGLLSMRIVPPDLATHSMNSAIYTMLLGDRLSLDPKMTSFIAMSLIYQDLDRLVGISVAQRDRETGLDPDRQFSANLRDVARMLGRVKGDVVSTLRVLTTYERGCPFQKRMANPFYRRPRSLHLVSRMLDLCRTYDLLIQGLEGYKTRRPDLAVEYIQSRSGEAFDPSLVDLLTSTLGVYPIGTTVQLTSGEKAVVIKTPDPAKDARRPVVRILNVDQPEVIDLAQPQFMHIEIVGSVDVDPEEITVSKVFLLS